MRKPHTIKLPPELEDAFERLRQPGGPFADYPSFNAAIVALVLYAVASLEAEHGSPIACNSCGYCVDIDTYSPSLSPYADCKCPKCGSTNNQHNEDYCSSLQKAWNCKHPGTLTDAGKSANGHPLLKCAECGCVGLDWSMRGEPMPSANEKLSDSAGERRVQPHRHKAMSLPMPPCNHDQCPPTHCKVLAAATCSPALAGLIAQLEEAAKSQKASAENLPKNIVGYYMARAASAAFLEAAHMARECQENDPVEQPPGSGTPPTRKPI